MPFSFYSSIGTSPTFSYPTLFIHAGDYLLAPGNERLGLVWGRNDYRGKEYPLLGVLYEKKDLAQLAYHTFRAWNMGGVIDRDRNIVVSIVSEGHSRYSIFLYPGERSSIKKQAQVEIENKLPNKSEVKICLEAKPYFFNPAQYSERPKVEELVRSLKCSPVLLLYTMYLDSQSIVCFNKRPLQLKSIRFVTREEVAPSMIEHCEKWYDILAKQPELVEKARKIKLG